MKFDPLTLIRIAQRANIDLERIGNDILTTNAPPELIAVLKKHKRQIIKHLPDSHLKSVQADLFETIP